MVEHEQAMTVRACFWRASECLIGNPLPDRAGPALVSIAWHSSNLEYRGNFVGRGSTVRVRNVNNEIENGAERVSIEPQCNRRWSGAVPAYCIGLFQGIVSTHSQISVFASTKIPALSRLKHLSYQRL